MSDVDVIIQVHTQGVQQIGNLSASLRNLSNTLRGVTVPMSKLDAHTKAVHKALGITSRGVDAHAKSIKQLAQNQKVLALESRRLKGDISNLKNAYALAGGQTTELGRSISKTTKELQIFSRTFRGMRLRALGSDLQNISLRMSKLGKDAQFVGRSLLINLTLPIATFARIGLQNFLAVEKQLVRITKVMEDLAPTMDVAAQKILGVSNATASMLSPAQQKQAERLVKNFKDMDAAITGLSTKFAVSKDLVASISADFGELGLTAQKNVNRLTQLTLEIEKLGNMDVGPAQDLTQALYFQSRRALELTGALKNVTTAREREQKAIDASITQMYLFNAIENATALTLKDLGDSFAEVSAMATSYGLSMTEAAAMLAPMKAAGLDVGASANSIKVSLQRLLAPTKQNVDTLKKLAAQYGVAENKQNEFLLSTKTGLVGLEAVVKVFDRVRDSSQGSEGALRLMSDLFEKRQGPRMYLAIEQLSDFNSELKLADQSYYKLKGTSQSAEVQLVKAAESATSGFSSFNTTIVPKTIRSFKDIGIIARIASAYAGQAIEIEPGKTKFITQADIKNAKAMRQATSDYIKEAKQARGIDIISEVKTEAGRAMMVELAGAANAQQVAQQELDRSLQTTGVAVDKIKNAFKLFAADIISRLAPAIEKVSKKVVEMYETWMSPEFDKTRQTIINLITSLGSFLAVMGPIILAIGTFQSVVGKVGLGIARFIPKLRNVEGEFVGLGRSIDIAKNSMNKLYESFIQLTGSRARPAALAPTPGGRVPQLPQAVTPAQRARMLNQARRDAMNAAGVTAAERRAAQAEFRRGTRAPATGHRARGSTGRMLPRNVVEALRIMEARELADVTPTPTGLLRSPSTGRMVSPTSGAASIRENLLAPVRRQESIFARSSYFEKAGIATDRMGTQFIRGGRRITEDQANRIAKGGIGSLVARTQIAGSAVGQRAMTPIRAIGRAGTAARAAMATAPSTGAGVVRGSVAATKSILRTTQAWQGASAALAAYNAKMLAFNAAPATGFKRLAIFITGFIRNMKLATIATKIFKMSLMFTGVGAIIAGIAAVVFLVIKNMDKIKGATKAWDALKRAFGLIKDAAMEIVRPIQDLFAQFGSGADEGEAAGQGIAKVFEGIAKAVEFVAGLIKMIVTKVIKPYLYGIVNIVMAVVQLFKGNWKDALKFLLAAVSQIAIGVISLFQMLAKAVISVMGGLAKGIVNLWFKGIVNGLYQAIVLALRGIVNLIGKIPGVNVITDPINNALKKVGGFISTVTSGVANTINKGIDGLGNFGKKAIDVVGDGLKNGLKKGADLGIKESSNKIKTDKKVPDAAEEQGDLAGEAIADAYGDAPIEGANDKIAGKIKEGIMDAVQKLQDYIAGRFASALKKFITDSVKALNKQKESALKVFDVQINTLMKLEKAEESLTKKKEYETNRRKLIDDATLRGEVYRRNRALAIYEGRIDDARILDLEEQQAAKESTQELATLDESRRKDLAKENLEALRDAINNAKELAGKFFDESVEKFQEAAEHITRIAPVTIEQYTAQLAELQTLTTQTADTNNLEFGKMFEKFATTIAEKMPNAVDDFGKALGAFSTPLDELVNLAMQKYGLGSEDEATVLGVTRKMADSVIGITLGMLTNIGDKFEGSATPVIEKFGDFKNDVMGHFTTLLEQTKTAFLEPYKKALDEADPVTVFKNAIIDGNTEILRSFQNMVDLNPDLMKKLAKSLDPAILKYIELKAAIDAANEAAGGSGGGGNIPNSSYDPETARFMRIRETAVANFRKSQQLQLDTFTRSLGVEDVVGLIGSSNLGRFTQGRTLPSPKRMPITRAEGGPVSKDAAFQSTPYGISGFLNAPEQQGIPAILHGGEFVINADAVKRIGLGALAKLNDPRIPKFKKGGFVGTADQAERKTLAAAKSLTAKNTINSTVDSIERKIKQDQQILKDPEIQKKLVNNFGIAGAKRMVESYEEPIAITKVIAQKKKQVSATIREVEGLKEDVIGRKTLQLVRESSNQVNLINDMKGDVIGRKAIRQPQPPPKIATTPLGNVIKGVGNTAMGAFRFAKGNITGDDKLTERGASQLLGGLKDTLNPVNLIPGLLFELPKEILMGFGRTLSGKNLVWGQNSVLKTVGKAGLSLFGIGEAPKATDWAHMGIGLVEDVMNIASIFTLGGTALAKPLATASLKTVVEKGAAQQGLKFFGSMARASGDNLLEASVAKIIGQYGSGEISESLAMQLTKQQVFDHYATKGTTNFLRSMYEISNPKIRQGALDIWAKVTGKEIPRAAMPNMLTAYKVFKGFDPDAAVQSIIRQGDLVRAAQGGQSAIATGKAFSSPVINQVMGELLPGIPKTIVDTAELIELGEKAIGGTFARRGLPPVELPPFPDKDVFLENLGEIKNITGLDQGPMRPDAIFDFSPHTDPTTGIPKPGSFLELFNMQREGNPLTDLENFLTTRHSSVDIEKYRDAVNNYAGRGYRLMNLRLAMLRNDLVADIVQDAVAGKKVNPHFSDFITGGYAVHLPKTTIDNVTYDAMSTPIEEILHNLLVQKRVDELNANLMAFIDLHGIKLPRQVPVWRGSEMPYELLEETSRLGAIMPSQFSSTSLQQNVGMLFSNIFSSLSEKGAKTIQEITLPADLRVGLLDALYGASFIGGESEVLLSPNTILRTLGYTTTRNQKTGDILHILKQRAETVGRAIQGPIEMGPIGSTGVVDIFGVKVPGGYTREGFQQASGFPSVKHYLLDQIAKWETNFIDSYKPYEFYRELFPYNNTLAIPAKTGMPKTGAFGGPIEITQAMRGIDLLGIIRSGIIDSKMPGVGGYISNQTIMKSFGVDPEITGFSNYNRIREAMESVDGVLRGNSNYGYARYEDDFLTAAQYASLHTNNIEPGSFYSNPEAAAWANWQLELDRLLGEVFVNLIPKPNMTYTLGDSYGMYRAGINKNMGNYVPGEVLALPDYPAPFIPENINNLYLHGQYGQGGYTEIQFPPTPMTPEYIKSITMLRRGELWKDLTNKRVVNFDKLDKWEESIRAIPGMENYSLANDPRFINSRTINPERFLRPEGTSTMGWGTTYWDYIGPQESLVMMREMMLKLKQMGIKVESGVVSSPIPRASRGRLKRDIGGLRTFYLDDVSLQDLTDEEFNRMLIKYYQAVKKMKANQQRRAGVAEIYERFDDGILDYTAIPMPAIGKSFADLPAIPNVPPMFTGKMDTTLADLMGGPFIPPGFSPDDLNTPLGRISMMLETGMGRINRPGNIKPIASTAYMAQLGEPVGGIISPFKLGSSYLPKELANPGVPDIISKSPIPLDSYPIEVKLPISSQLANADIALGHGTAVPDVYKNIVKGIDMEIKNYYVVKRVAERQQDDFTKELAARSEVLASRLYSLFGMDTVRPQMLSNLFDDDGNFISNAIVSRYIPNLVPYETALQGQKTKGLYDLARMKFQHGGLIDAWLGNYDVIGYSTNSANLAALLDPTGVISRVIRTDVGGALGFSGTGKIKLPNLDDEATRLGLTTPSFGLYPQEFDQFFKTKVGYVPQARAYDLFHDMSVEELLNQGNVLEYVATNGVIRKNVHEVLAGSPEDAENIVQILIARRDFILNKLDELKPRVSKPLNIENGVFDGTVINPRELEIPKSSFQILSEHLASLSPGWAEFASKIPPELRSDELRNLIYGTIDPARVERFRHGGLSEGGLGSLLHAIDKDIMNEYVSNLNKHMNMRLLDIYAQETGKTTPLEAYVKIMESLLSFSSAPGGMGTTGVAPLTQFIYENPQKYLGINPAAYAARTNGKLRLQPENIRDIEQFLKSGLMDVPERWLEGGMLPRTRVDLISVLTDPDIAQYINSILQGAGRAVDSYGSPMPFDMNVFRGIKMFAPAGNPMQYLEQIYEPGKLLPPQYISSSINPQTALNFARATSLSIPVLENIKIQQGQKVWFPGIMGQGIGGEYEVTIPPTYQFVVKELVERMNPAVKEQGAGLLPPVFFEAIGELVPSTFKNYSNNIVGKILATAGLAGGSLAMMTSPDRAEAMSTDRIGSYLEAISNLNNFISSGETSNISDPYNAINPLNTPAHEKLTKMTIAQAVQYGKDFRTLFKDPNVTGAIGKYQNLPELLENRALLAGFNQNTLFTPTVQEKIAEQFLLKEWGGNGVGIEKYFQGKMSLNEAINRIAQIYRGMPAASGTYVGGGGNTTGTNMHKLNTLKEYLTLAKMRYIPGFKNGGFVKGATSKAIPATLHGGEYVLNAKAVNALGIPTLNALNMINPSNRKKPDPDPDHPSRRKIPPSKEVQRHTEQNYDPKTGRYIGALPRPGATPRPPRRPTIPMPPPLPKPGDPQWNMQIPNLAMGGMRFSPPITRTSTIQAPVTNNMSTVNIQVENFIGQEEWFNSMMKEYNVNVLPKNQKLAGLEQRKFTSYNGINQGM